MATPKRLGADPRLNGWAFRKMSAIERFGAHYEPEPMSGCWLWTGRLDTDGYGGFRVNNRMIRAYRFAYETFVGPIRSETVDHRCRVRSCVNPAHLRLASSRDNTLCGNGITAQLARQTTCKRGHEFTVKVRADGRLRRQCDVCRSAAQGGTNG